MKDKKCKKHSKNVEIKECGCRGKNTGCSTKEFELITIQLPIFNGEKNGGSYKTSL